MRSVKAPRRGRGSATSRDPPESATHRQTVVEETDLVSRGSPTVRRWMGYDGVEDREPKSL